MKAWLDESGKAPVAGCNDVLFLYIAAIGEHGTIVLDFDDEVCLEIDGDATIMNVGDISAEAGIAAALFQIGDNAGKINFTAKATGEGPI